MKIPIYYGGKWSWSGEWVDIEKKPRGKHLVKRYLQFGQFGIFMICYTFLIYMYCEAEKSVSNENIVYSKLVSTTFEL